jgi:hypothetical protein
MSDEGLHDIEAEEARELEAQAASKQEAGYEIADLAWLMGNKRGRRIVWRLLSHAGLYRLSHQPGDAFATAFNEGQRNQGLRLAALLQAHCRDDYALMHQERAK